MPDLKEMEVRDIRLKEIISTISDEKLDKLIDYMLFLKAQHKQ